MWWWARTGSHKGPNPTSTSSPAPTIHGLCGPIRRIVGASGERMWWESCLWDRYRPCGRPSGLHSILISFSWNCLFHQMNLYGLYISYTLLAIFVFTAFNCYNGYGNILWGEKKYETPVVLLISPTPVVSCGGCDRFLHTSMVP